MVREGKLIEIVSVPVKGGPPLASPSAQRGERLVAFPWAYLVDVCRLTEGRAALVTAAFIYRRTHVCKSRTVTLPGTDMAELGVGRELKRKALARLEAAGIIRIESNEPGCTAEVTLLWKSK